jgi:hypothetical protein
MGKGPVYWWDRYEDTFKPRVAEIVKSLGDHGKYSDHIEISVRSPEMAIKDADEIRRLAQELKDSL